MKKVNFRINKINQEIKKTLSFILYHKMNDPRIDFKISILNVSISLDLSVAKVFFSVLHDDQKKEMIVILNKAAIYIRKLLSQHIFLRVIPALIFVYDGSFIHGMRLTKLINRSLSIDSSMLY
ncbi:MAG: 30S ribosome-binding factor RbfA [Buchnera aphidicola (Eriosoma harunire)]